MLTILIIHTLKTTIVQMRMCSSLFKAASNGAYAVSVSRLFNVIIASLICEFIYITLLPLNQSAEQCQQAEYVNGKNTQ